MRPSMFFALFALVVSSRANIVIINDTTCTTFGRWGYLTGGCPWNGSSQPNYIANYSIAVGGSVTHTDDQPGWAVVYGKWCNTHNTWEYVCCTSPGTYYLSAMNTDQCGTASLTNYCSYSVRNNSSGRAAYQLLWPNGSPVYGVYGMTFLTLDAGRSGSLYFYTTTNCADFRIMQFTGPTPDLSVVSTNQMAYVPRADGLGITNVMNTNWYGVFQSTSSYTNASGPVITGTGPVIYNNPASNGSNSPITFTTNAVSGDNINTLQTGFGALYSAVNAGFANQDANLRAIDGNLVSGMNGVSNAIKAMGTNGGGSNVVYGSMTSGTNWSTANAAGSAALGGAATDAGDAADRVALGPPSIGGGSGSALTMTIANQSLNFDPENSVFSGIAGITKACLGFLAIGTFCMWAGRRYSECVKTFATAQTGGVPNLEVSAAGFGGNVGGVALGILVPVVLVGGWVAIFQFLFGEVLTRLTTLHSTNPYAGFTPLALYLIDQYVPMSLILSLFWARLTLYFTLEKLVMLASAATRFLFGK